MTIASSLLCCLLAFALALTLTALVRRYAPALRLVQAPNHRSSHEAPTPTSGGIGIVIGASVPVLWLTGQGELVWLPVLGLGLLLAVVGLLDDLIHLPARVRFAVQIGVCATLLWVLPAPPIALAGNLVLGGLALAAFLLIAGCWWINLFNFMDGIDGIAGMQAVFMLTAAALLACAGQPQAPATTAWWLLPVIACATLGFLMLNWPPAKIFMGDAGSTFLAFMLLAVALASVRAGWLGYASWAILGASFIADATVTLIRRVLRGERFSEAHRSHAYQRLARLWAGERKAGHRRSTTCFLAVNALWLAPLAWAAQVAPAYAWSWLLLAYLPLMFGAWRVGAGMPGDIGQKAG